MTVAMPTQTEAQFQGAILKLAQLSGWKTYHTLNSRGSTAGWPDLVMVRGPRLVIAELKTEKGRPSVDQQAWLHALEHTTAGLTGALEVGLWRPSDWPEIEKLVGDRS